GLVGSHCAAPGRSHAPRMSGYFAASSARAPVAAIPRPATASTIATSELRSRMIVLPLSLKCGGALRATHYSIRGNAAGRTGGVNDVPDRARDEALPGGRVVR